MFPNLFLESLSSFVNRCVDFIRHCQVFSHRSGLSNQPLSLLSEARVIHTVKWWIYSYILMITQSPVDFIWRESNFTIQWRRDSCQVFLFECFLYSLSTVVQLTILPWQTPTCFVSEPLLCARLQHLQLDSVQNYNKIHSTECRATKLDTYYTYCIPLNTVVFWKNSTNLCISRLEISQPYNLH